MIIGTGIDVVNIERFARTIERTPALVNRLFVEQERNLPLRSLAARFAAKEAVAKALGAPAGMVWQHCWVERERGQAPRIVCRGTVAAAAAELGVNSWHLSMSHDDPVAIATVIAEHLIDAELARRCAGKESDRNA